MRFRTLYRVLPATVPIVAPVASQAQEASSLPVLQTQIPAAYPERALERALEADVVLTIEVDPEGRVSGVTLTEPAGHGFDAPAVEAAWSMVFEPATDARGRPIAARVVYRYPFRMAAVPPLSIDGSVRAPGAKQGYANALIQAVGPNGEIARTRSDERGRFRFAALTAGDWVLTVSGPTLFASSATVTVPEGAFAEGVVLTAEPVPEWLDGYDARVAEYVEVAADRRPDPAEREIDHDVIVTLPGSLGDPLRAVQNLPGVARAPFGSGQIAIRGANTDDTGYYIDGVRVPLAFHFTAVSTVVAADLLSSVGFYPGGWSVRYGRAIGGIVDLQTNDDLPGRSASSVSADLFQVSALTRLRLGPRAALTLSARRSYIDALAQPILSGVASPSVRLPRYYDAQIHFVRAIGAAGRFTATGLLSDDTFRVLGDGGTGSDDAVRYGTRFQRVLLRHLQPTGGQWSVETALAVGAEAQELIIGEGSGGLGAFGVPDLFGDLPSAGVVSERAVPHVSLRHEWYRDVGTDIAGLRFGLDSNWGRQHLEYTVGQGADEVATSYVWTPALYVEPTVQLGPLQILPGARLEVADLGPLDPDDPNNPLPDWALDTRLRGAATFGTTKMSLSVGTHHQPPGTRELLAVNGPSLTLEQSTQVSMGVEQRVFGDAKIGLTLYHSWLDSLVVGRDELFRFDRTVLTPGDRFIPFVNAGTGRAYGAELFGTWITDTRVLWLAVSAGRSFRRDLPDDDWLPAPADQPINATFIASQAFGKWRAGLRARFVSGPPVTPVASTVYSTDLQTWIPIYGDPLSERASPYLSVDLRVDRAWWFRKWRLDLYLELLNATNHRNVEIPGWSEDFTEEESVTGLPILPVFGAKASW